MGKRFIQRRKKDYFDFHRKSMRKFGERFMWRKVVVGALYVLGRGMLNLEESFEKVKRKIGKGNHLREYI